MAVLQRSRSACVWICLSPVTCLSTLTRDLKKTRLPHEHEMGGAEVERGNFRGLCHGLKSCSGEVEQGSSQRVSAEGQAS